MKRKRSGSKTIKPTSSLPPSYTPAAGTQVHTAVPVRASRPGKVVTYRVRCRR